jgi:predicted metalloprotease
MTDTHTFTGQTSTGCGAASSQVGPFYCPQDDTVYLDTGFFDEVLEQQLGGPDGGFVEAYVIGHEYGHHIQDVTGTMGKVRTQQGANSDAVRLELQADCYAGMWARSATKTEDATGEVLISELTDEDIRLAIEAAESVGDDRIQEKTSGRVNPESWTHGSAEQRQRWFNTGYRSGSYQDCDTFSAGAL